MKTIKMLVLALVVMVSGSVFAGQSGDFTYTDNGIGEQLKKVITDADWEVMNPEIPGANQSVDTILYRNGNLYVGGEFYAVGNTRANCIAKWNGTSWSALSSGVNYKVSALAVDSSGNLYAGGSFTTAGGVTTNGIAKWDGTSWSALGSGLNGNVGDWVGVYALAVDSSGNLYVGGSFNTAGGVTANNIAKWDGTSWSALGSGMNSRVSALAFDPSGNLYAGGYFTTAGGVSANRIAKWDGTSWSALGSGMNQNGAVTALAVNSSGNLYAGGEFTTAGGITANFIAKWDGTSWSALGSGMNNYVSALAVDSSGNLYAGGMFTTAGDITVNHIAKWDGTSWSALGSGIGTRSSDGVSAVAFDSSGNLYAGGGIITAGGVTANGIAKWNGTSWSALGSGMNNYVSALAADSSGNLYAGGMFTTAGGVTANSIAKWDGTSWSVLGSGMNGGGVYGPYVSALVVDSSGNLYAGGDFTTAGGVSANSIAKWDGTSWSALGSGMHYVHALSIDSSGNLYAGGEFTTAGGVSANNIAKWNGTSWSALGSGTDSGVCAMAVDSSGNLYAGGWFTTAGGISAINIAKWDGANWSALGSGTDYFDGVYALAVDSSDKLYVGGGFITAGGVTVNNIAKWDGTSWSALGSGINEFVYALSIDSSGNLYVGGGFTTAGGVSANGIAKWDGTSWSAFGSGVDGNGVSALAFDPSGNLYAGGSFTTAGGKFSPYIAKCMIGTPSTKHSISGIVSGSVGVMLTLSGSCSSTTTSGADGTFTFEGLSDGSYTVTPNLSGYTFAPSRRNITVSGNNVTGCGFVATKNPGTYSISGTVSGGVQEGVTTTLSGALSSTTFSGVGGLYSFTGLADGSYTVTPNFSGYTFAPFSQDVTIAGANQPDINFTATAISIFGQILKPSFNASCKDSVKKIVGIYSQYSTDKFTIQATIQFPETFVLTNIGEDTGFTLDFGLYSFNGKLGNAKSKFNGEKGGSASFKITGNDEIKGKMVTIEKVDLRWDKNRKLTVRITGTPASNSNVNVVDLSGKANGPVTGNIDTFVLTFSNAGANFAKGESLAYTGKKNSKTVIKDKGKESEKTFTLVDWSAKGKK